MLHFRIMNSNHHVFCYKYHPDRFIAFFVPIFDTSKSDKTLLTYISYNWWLLDFDPNLRQLHGTSTLSILVLNRSWIYNDPFSIFMVSEQSLVLILKEDFFFALILKVHCLEKDERRVWSKILREKIVQRFWAEGKSWKHEFESFVSVLYTAHWKKVIWRVSLFNSELISFWWFIFWGLLLSVQTSRLYVPKKTVQVVNSLFFISCACLLPQEIAFIHAHGLNVYDKNYSVTSDQ